jgi:leader peptidase (prepilin peptidase)/N-methyltransferase
LVGANPALLSPLSGQLGLPWFEVEIALLTAFLGACVGSFLNVVVWRVPREESVLWPPSHCPRCGTVLAWFENIPVLSWLALRGRCRHCEAPIGLRYPAVEALCGGLWVLMLLAQPSAMGPNPAQPLLWLSGWIFVSLLLLLALIDGDQLWIPEPLCRWGVMAGWLLTVWVGWHQSPAVARTLLASHLVGATAGLVGFEALAALAARWMGRPALGSGDAKVGALLGAWLGPLGLALAVMQAVLLAALFGGLGLLSGLLKRHQPIPFVPFLALGGGVMWWTGVAPWQSWWLGR